jgi:hypothetical protein
MKVREVSYEEKSISEQEKELLAKHEEEQNNNIEDKDNPPVENPPIIDDAKEEIIDEVQKFELDDTSVLDYLKSKSGKELDSLESLFEEKSIELPEDVEAFYKYKKETGRSLNDFIELNRDFDSEDADKVLSKYIKAQNPELDAEDIAFEMEKFKYDEDLDDDATIKNAKLSMKKELAKAKDYFNGLKEQYKAPLESRDPLVPQEELEQYNAYKEYKGRLSTEQEEQMKRSKYFADKTEELFSDKFEGFGFDIDGENKVVYKPGDTKAIKEQQSDLKNFVGKFLNEEGYLGDAEAFHKAIAIANDPDKFAKFFYEKGKADSTKGFEKESKNIDMVRNQTTSVPKDGPIVRAVDSSSGNGLKFKQR